MVNRIALIVTVFLFYLCPVQARDDIPAFVSFQQLDPESTKPAATFNFFLISSEMQIGKIKHFVEETPVGAYVTVGAERGFRGASMAPNTTNLFLMDIVPDIHRFNRINTELLKTPSREYYRHLRWEASYDEWAAHKQKVEKEFSKPVKLDRDDFQWWVKRVRDLESMQYPLPEILNRKGHWPYPIKFSKIRAKLLQIYTALEKSPDIKFTQKEFLTVLSREEIQAALQQANISTSLSEKEWDWWYSFGRNESMVCSKLWLKHPEQAIDLGAVLDYKSGNYLFDDKLYQRLHNLAVNNRITIIEIDLTDSKQILQVADFFKLNKIKIGVLDLNNLEFTGYLGEKNYQNILKALLSFGEKDSVLITMENYKDYACAQFQIYIGFTFENVRNWDPRFKLQTFIEKIPDEIYPVIDGKLYVGQEKP